MCIKRTVFFFFLYKMHKICSDNTIGKYLQERISCIVDKNNLGNGRQNG